MQLNLIIRLILLTFTLAVLHSNTSAQTSKIIEAKIDLVNIKDDKVSVTITPPPITTSKVTYQFARTIPGTYSVADYGRYIEKLAAKDASGNLLPIKQKDVNTWVISNAQQLKAITYQVNDTYDNEKEGNPFDPNNTTIFSPAGTNILADENFMLNMCGFVGYFPNMMEAAYDVIITHPEKLWAGTALDDKDPSNISDKFLTNNFATLVDNPIMYSTPDYTTFKVSDLEVLLSVHSVSNKNITAKSLSPDLERMVKAQKTFLGNISNTKKYAVLVYVTSGSKTDASGIGALEHNTSTTGVFRPNMSSEDLIHVIAHEFFHTVTPLNIHSKEIHYFDFNKPKMSQHLWLYEGVTEYFAHLFQVNQGLIDEAAFFKEMAEKEKLAKYAFKDNMSFTKMSKNVLKQQYKTQYANVYMKGALMAMCMDILIREKSNGTRGIKDMMGELAKMYGPEKPFDDKELIAKVTELTYPEVGEFIKQHIVKGVPIDYATYYKKAGVENVTLKVQEQIVFVANNKPYIKIDTTQKKVLVLKPEGNNFFTALGAQENDELVAMNDIPFDANNRNAVIYLGYGLKEDSPVKLTVKRNGEQLELKGNAKLNYKDGGGYMFKDKSKEAIKEAWLKG